jgi:thiamine pyridinylase
MDSKVSFRTLLLLLLFSLGMVNALNRNASLNIIMSAGQNISAIETVSEKQHVTNNRTTLKVALFPYIPDSGGDNYAGLQQFIKGDFERAFPQYNVELRQINPSEDFYDLSTLITWLTDPVNGYDVVEIDTVVLGDLVNTGLITPQWIAPSYLADWNSAATTAIQFNQAYYAYPHLQCAFFLITYIPEVSQAKTMDQLVQSLGGTPSNIHRIVGNLDSSWDLPALWLNSAHDTYNDTYNTTARALHGYNIYTFDSLRKLARLCDTLAEPNRCLDGTFDDPNYMTDLFIQGQAAAMFGYSERLFRIIKNGFPGSINLVKVNPLPLGTIRNEPVFFTDAFVFRQNMANDVRQAAETFVTYMGLPPIQAIFVGSGDNPSPNRVPRYLLPVSKLAYDQPLLKLDPIYQQVFRGLNGVSYPTAGFLNARKGLQNAILQYIQ